MTGFTFSLFVIKVIKTLLSIANNTNFKQDNIEYIGNNSYIPTSGNCFVKGINSFTKNEYTEDF